MIAAGRPATLAKRLSVAALDRQRAADAALREMLHQPEEEREVGFRDALLVERQDVVAGLGAEQKVGVFDALGDALEGEERAEIVGAQKRLEVGIADIGVDRHA